MTVKIIYMLEHGEYPTETCGPLLGAPDLDFSALKAEYRTERYGAAEAKGEDWCFVDASSFIDWLVMRGTLVRMDSVVVNVDIDTSGENRYAPRHWPLCPACEEGRGEDRTGDVRHALNAVQHYRCCTACAHIWDHRWKQWCSDRPMLEDDGRYTDSGCVPYAISQAGGLPFAQVADACRRRGWREGRGMRDADGLAVARELGLEVLNGRPSAMAGGDKLTLGRFLRAADPQRRYIVSVRDHWLAVVGGQVRETADTNMRTQVMAFWEVRRVPASAAAAA